jgi:hypothetical protein
MTIYYVSQDGNDGSDGLSVGNAWRKLSYAIANVPDAAGHVLEIEAGDVLDPNGDANHNIEDENRTNQLVIRPTNHAGLANYATGATIIGNSGTINLRLQGRTSNITFQHVQINANQTYYTACQPSFDAGGNYGENITFEDCVFIFVDAGGGWNASSQLMLAYPNENFSLTRCTFTNSLITTAKERVQLGHGTVGGSGKDFSGMAITDCILNSIGGGLAVFPGIAGGANATGVTVTGGTYTVSANSGIPFRFGAESRDGVNDFNAIAPVIDGVTVVNGGTTHTMTCNAIDATIKNCTVTSTTCDYGLVLKGQGYKVHDNTIAAEDCLLLKGAERGTNFTEVEIYDNTFTPPTSHAAILADVATASRKCSDLNIHHNTFLCSVSGSRVFNIVTAEIDTAKAFICDFNAYVLATGAVYWNVMGDFINNKTLSNLLTAWDNVAGSVYATNDHNSQEVPFASPGRMLMGMIG